jgi:hypothetical protein
METYVRRALSRAVSALKSLGEQPAALFCALLVLNAVVGAYVGLGHDARLYAGQVLHRLGEPCLADDLFFRYGSQDQYSLFSIVVAPLANLLGVGWTFFLLYLAAKAFQIWAMLRLVRTLIPDRTVSTLALLFLMVSMLGYGGFGIFRVNEDFLTPRLVTTAMVLLGLEKMLRGRFLAALGLMLLSVPLHPIMAAPGLAALALWWACTRLPRRWLLLAALGTLATVVVLAFPAVGGAVFGQMDEEWVTTARYGSPYASPLDWSRADHVNILVTLGLLLTCAWVCRRDRYVPGLALVAVLVGAGGLAAAIVGSVTGYALLFQGQLYRALWLAAFLVVPLSLWTSARLWVRPGAGRLLALCVLAALCIDRRGMEPDLFAWCWPVMVIFLRGLKRVPRDADWLWRSVALSLLAAVVGRVVVTEILFVSWRSTTLAQVDGLDYWRLLLMAPGPVPWTLAAVAVLTLVYAWPGFGAGYRRAAVAVALAVQLGLFLLPGTAFYRERYYFFHQDVDFMAHFLESARRPGQAPPTVYWCNGNLGTLWLDLHVTSYYQLQQVQGLLFSQATAQEAQRRALVVSQFEMERQRRERAFIAPSWVDRLEGYYRVSIDTAEPTRADLERLCRDEALDYAVLQQDIDGLYAACNGRFFIYDCRQLRARLGSASNN